MTVLHAHFDGKVLVPDGPVDLPQGRLLEIHVLPAADEVENELPPRGSRAALLQAIRSRPKVGPHALDLLTKAIEEGKLPVQDKGIFEE